MASTTEPNRAPRRAERSRSCSEGRSRWTPEVRRRDQASEGSGCAPSLSAARTSSAIDFARTGEKKLGWPMSCFSSMAVVPTSTPLARPVTSSSLTKQTMPWTWFTSRVTRRSPIAVAADFWVSRALSRRRPCTRNPSFLTTMLPLEVSPSMTNTPPGPIATCGMLTSGRPGQGTSRKTVQSVVGRRSRTALIAARESPVMSASPSHAPRRSTTSTSTASSATPSDHQGQGDGTPGHRRRRCGQGRSGRTPGRLAATDPDRGSPPGSAPDAAAQSGRAAWCPGSRWSTRVRRGRCRSATPRGRSTAPAGRRGGRARSARSAAAAASPAPTSSLSRMQPLRRT